MTVLRVDIRRLRQIVTEEVARALNAPRVVRPARRPGLAAIVDHTILRPDATAADIDTACVEARRHGFATVCVNPFWIPRVRRQLAGSPIGVCSVAAFPFGATPTPVKVAEARQAVADGATEVDVVINIGALRGGDYELVYSDLAAVVVAVRAGGGRTKVILETCDLDDAQKVAGAVLTKAAGADFVKTSTGFRSGGATVDDVALLRRTVGDVMGVKASGGIRDAATARAMVAAGATRIGTSAGVAIAGADGSE